MGGTHPPGTRATFSGVRGGLFFFFFFFFFPAHHEFSRRMGRRERHTHTHTPRRENQREVCPVRVARRREEGRRAQKPLLSLSRSLFSRGARRVETVQYRDKRARSLTAGPAGFAASRCSALSAADRRCIAAAAAACVPDRYLSNLPSSFFWPHSTISISRSSTLPPIFGHHLERVGSEKRPR